MTQEELSTMAMETEARSKSNSHRIDKLEVRQDSFDKLVSSVAVLAEKQERMEGDLSEIKSDVKAIAAKPGRRWDAIVEKIIFGVVAAILAYILAHMGL